MFRIMSYFAVILVLLFFLCPIALQQTIPPKALNPERIKLLKDALSWMTFRKNGELASDQDLEPFFEVLKDRYLKSKYYKTVVIAFSRGVLPKLILKENEPCDSSFTLEYKDSFNNSVTDGQLKKFIFQSYDKRGQGNRQFCDYREGLICNQQTRKCECPEGSKMEPISQGSTVKRCLVQENQICSLIDLDHDPSSDYGALKKHLPEMVFNLEKPQSCRMGSQCRFKSSNPTTPFCFGVTAGPWDKGRWDKTLGDECTLGLYGDTGQCIRSRSNFNSTLSNLDGYTCFNFGPRSQPRSSNVGFCAHDMGSYGFTTYSTSNYQHGPDWPLQMIGFVSPATTPLRGKGLFDYYSEYRFRLTHFFANWNGNSAMAPYAGYRCNIEKTEKMLTLWKFFKSLEETPPPGKDYVATEAELWAKYKEAEALTVDRNRKICRVNTHLRPGTWSSIQPGNALRCVRNSTDADGNDGRCEVIPENEDVTWSWAQTFLQYRNHVGNIYVMEKFGDKNYRKDIFEPEIECNPKLGPPPGSEGAAPSNDSDVLEGGYCPPDRGCYEDNSDYWEIYDENCTLKDVKRKLYRNCQDLNENRRYEKCEVGQLDKIFQDELDTLPTYSRLQRGDACQYDFEEKLRTWIKTNGGNKYQRLIEIFTFKNGIGVKGLCDRTKLLECSESGTCECLQGTKPREVNLAGDTTVFSDYCYAVDGYCDPRRDLRFIFDSSSRIETSEINRHYKAKDIEQRHQCMDSNWCVFKLVEPEDEAGWVNHICTTTNTGSTGYDGSEPVTTTTTEPSTEASLLITTTDRDESELMCVGDACGWQEAGVAQKDIHVILKTMILIKMLTIFV